MYTLKILPVIAGVALLAGCGSDVAKDLELPLEREINFVKFKDCLMDRLILDGGQCRRQSLEYAFEQCYTLYVSHCTEEAYEFVYKD